MFKECFPPRFHKALRETGKPVHGRSRSALMGDLPGSAERDSGCEL